MRQIVLTGVTVLFATLLGAALGDLTSAALPPSVASGPASSPRLSPPRLSAPLPLLTYQLTGGRCVYGLCFTEVVIYRDRTFKVTVGPTVKNTGKISRPTMRQLIQQIKAADFTTIRADQFTGTCPIAFDGQEATYTFYTRTRQEQIASCETNIDPTDPLFDQTNQIVQQLLAEP